MAEPHSSGAPVHVDPEGGHDLVVEGVGTVVRIKHGPLAGPEDVVGAADVRSLAEAARALECCARDPEWVMVARCTAEEFDEELFDADEVSIRVDADSFGSSFEVTVSPEGPTQDELAEWLEQAAALHACTIGQVEHVNKVDLSWMDEVFHEGEDQGVDSWRREYRERVARRARVLEVHVAPTSPMSVAELLTAGREVRALAEAIKGGPLTVTTAMGLLRSRLPHLLIGLPESEWFDAKQVGYPLAVEGPPGARAKIELAQDVARFANGSVDAVLVLGLVTTKQDGVDVVSSVKPIKLSSLNAQQYQDVIDDRVYPAVEGLVVERVDIGDGRGLLMVYIPAQPPEYQPFLVHGAFVEGKVEGAFISIVRRRGEASIAIEASQIHATLVAGRSWLRGNPAQD